MEPTRKETSQVAWFKLAEFIQRGERERALSICKLLMHTVQEKAVALQLEGDLYNSLNDPVRARDCYVHAARLYCEKRDFAHAAAIYERLVRVYPEREDFLEKLVCLYQDLGHPARTFFGMQQLIKPLVLSDKTKQLNQAFKLLAPFVSVREFREWRQTIEHELKHAKTF